jgi:glutamyl-tRNA(Gln) amidotransferase subunit E
MDFGEMSPADYDTLGFMAGLEVHQQLHTATKLFCRCPAGIKTTRVDAEVLRHMRPTLSELGEYDGCALMEFKTRKEIVYLLERGSVCTYEIDDTPPFIIDHQAVDYALEIAQLFGLNLVSELHVMRKQYLDGSIPTGFQRTAMIGLNGSIPFRESELGGDRQLSIRQMTLEEDSCREVSDIGHRITFRTDRLGMPLIETVTEPELFTPHDVRAGIRLLAAVARASGKVRRGAGAARQDVNVSVAGGRRVEIKGVPSERIVPRLVHNEAFRQLNLLRIRAQLRERGVTPEMLGADLEDNERIEAFSVNATSLLKHADYAPLRSAIERGQVVRAVRLPLFRHLLAHKVQPGMTFAREIAGRLQVIACLQARPSMIHSDVMGYGLKGSRWNQLRAATHAEPDDALVVVWGGDGDTRTGVLEVLNRGLDALDGVPAETRQAFGDGTTGFERILPGPDRMYPDTDTPPLPISEGWMSDAGARIGVLPWQREDSLVARGLDAHQARMLAANQWGELLEKVCPDDQPVLARRLGYALLHRLPRHCGRRGGSAPSPGRLRPLCEAALERPALMEGFDYALDQLLEEESIDASEIVARFRPADDEEIDSAVRSAMEARPSVRTDEPPALMRWALGHVMARLRGRALADEVRQRLSRALEIPAHPEAMQASTDEEQR